MLENGVPQLGDALGRHADGRDDRGPPRRSGEIGQVEHLHEVPARLVDALAVGLVDHEDVGDLHQPGLVRLHAVTPARVDHHDRRVGLAGDLDLDLSDADGLDEDPLASDRVERTHRLGGGERESPEMAACGHRADEHAGVGGVVLHPNAIAEDRPSGEGRRGIDREHGDLELERAQVADDRARQRRLARSGRTGEPDRVAGSGAWVGEATDLSRLVVTALDQGEETGERRTVALEGRLEQFTGRLSCARHGGRFSPTTAVTAQSGRRCVRRRSRRRGPRRRC